MALTTAPAASERRGVLATVGWLLVLGLALRLALAPWFQGFGYDIMIFRDWTDHLLHDPLSQFYAVAQAPDHLPGDLWFLLGAGKLYTGLGGRSFRGTPFLVTLKLVPAVADLVIALLLYAIVRGQAGSGRASPPRAG